MLARRVIVFVLVVGVIVAMGVAVGTYFRATHPIGPALVGKHVLVTKQGTPLTDHGQTIRRLNFGEDFNVIAAQENQLKVSGGWIDAAYVVSYDEAIDYFTEEIRRLRTALSYAHRALAWKKLGDLDQALADYDKAIDLEPGNPRTYHNRARVWLSKGNSDRALSDFNESLRLDPYHPHSLAGRGEIMFDKGEFQAALADLDVAIQVQPDYAIARRFRAFVWLKLREFDKVIAECDEAIQIDPQNDTGHLYRGYAWQDKSDYEHALSDFEAAVRLAPTKPLPHCARGYLWLKKGEYAKAGRDLDKAVALDPNSAPALAARAGFRLKSGDFAGALADSQESLRLAPEKPSSNNIVAWCLATCPQSDLRNGQRAVELAKKANELSTTHEWYLSGTSAAAYAEAGDFDSAVKFAEESLELAPDAEKADIRARLELYRSGQPYREKQITLPPRTE